MRTRRGSKIEYKMPHLWAKDHRKKSYKMWPREEREIMWACDRYLAHIANNPPRITGWLKGGVDVERMKKIKADLERREINLGRIPVSQRAGFSWPRKRPEMDPELKKELDEIMHLGLKKLATAIDDELFKELTQEEQAYGE